MLLDQIGAMQPTGASSAVMARCPALFGLIVCNREWPGSTEFGNEVLIVSGHMPIWITPPKGEAEVCGSCLPLSSAAGWEGYKPQVGIWSRANSPLVEHPWALSQSAWEGDGKLLNLVKKVVDFYQHMFVKVCSVCSIELKLENVASLHACQGPLQGSS